jgi:phage FluMu protein Com
VKEIRCIKCKKLICKAEPPYRLELKCPRCGELQTQYRSEMIDYSNMCMTAKTILELAGKNTNKKESVENEKI